MKKTIVIIGVLLIILNTLAGVIFQNYSTNNVVFGDVSLLITFALIYIMLNIQSTSGMKIGFGFGYVISGFLRFICALSASPNFKNDFALFLFLIILVIEFIISLVYVKISNK